MSIQVAGNVGQDPDVKHFESGSMKATFSIADRLVTKKEGEDTEWRNIEVWGKTAEYVGNYVRQGSILFVEGDLITEKYEDKEGNKRTKVFIRANKLVNLTKREQDSSTQASETEATTTKKKTAAAKPTEVDEEIPF